MSHVGPSEGRDAAEELERLERFVNEFRPSTTEMEDVLRLAAEYYAVDVLAPEERTRFLADVLGFDRARQVLEEVRQMHQARRERRRFGFGPR
jgi:hypothetical protein